MNREELRWKLIKLIHRLELAPTDPLDLEDKAIVEALISVIASDDGVILDKLLDNLPPSFR